MENSDTKKLHGEELVPTGITCPEGIWIREAMRLLANKDIDQGLPAPTKLEMVHRIISILITTPQLGLFTVNSLDGEILPVDRSYLRGRRAMDNFFSGYQPFNNDYSSSGYHGQYIYVDKIQFRDFLEDKPVQGDNCVSQESSVNLDYIPPYVKLMLDAVLALELTSEKRIYKETIVRWLKDNWPDDLDGKSDRMIQSMATMLRSPEHKKGGNTPWE